MLSAFEDINAKIAFGIWIKLDGLYKGSLFQLCVSKAPPIVKKNLDYLLR